MARAGRKTILTHELINQIAATLNEGHYIETTCAFVGIHKSTYFDWLAKDRAYQEMSDEQLAALSVDENLTRQLLAEFADAVEKAQGQAEIRALRAINDDPSWQAKAWYLERSKPHRWGRRTQLTGAYDEDDKPTPVQIADPRLAVLGFLGELHDQLVEDEISDESSNQVKGNADDHEKDTTT